MINNKVNFYQIPTLSLVSSDVNFERVETLDHFVPVSRAGLGYNFSKSLIFQENIGLFKNEVFNFLNLLRFNHGAQFFKFEMVFWFESQLFDKNWNGFFTTSGRNSINNRENIPLWQKKIRERLDSQLLGRLNGFELLEFFYFNVVDVGLDDSRFRSEDTTKKYGYSFLVRLEVFLVSRSVVGVDCLDKFNEILCRPEKDMNKRSGPSTLKALNLEEANEFLGKLMGFVPIKYKDLNLDLSRMLFHGFYCFRDWRVDYNDNDKFHKQTAGSHGEFSQKFLYPYGELFKDGVGLGALTYHSYPYEPFLYLNDLTEEGSFLGPNHIRHKHADIFGLNVESTYDSPSVLLNLIRSYCILNKIKFIDGQIFKLINNSFLKPLGSLNWFKFNIFNILDELAEEFPVSISVIDKPYIVSKQLNNVIALIELDSNILFKEPATF